MHRVTCPIRSRHWNSKDEIADMIHSANEMAEKLSFVIADTGEVMSQMANGNYNITSKNPGYVSG